VVQERLDHSDISLTLNTHSPALPSMQKEVAEKMDELLTPIDISQDIHTIREQKPEYQGSTRE
jgi:hypothetical protein